MNETVGAKKFIDGIEHVYVGNGRWLPIEQPLHKVMPQEEMTSGMKHLIK